MLANKQTHAHHILNYSQMPRTRKQRGGSIASDNVNSIIAKSCTRFVYPTKVKAVMLNAQAHSSTPPMYPQVGGGAESQVSWFYSKFIPYMTQSCTERTTPTETVDAMQHLWNTEHPHAKLSKRAAKQMLREFVAANQNTTDTEAVDNQVNIPLQWMNESAAPASDLHTSYEMVGGASDCLYDTNYTVHKHDNYDRYRSNSGGIPPHSFKSMYDWFHGDTTIFAPTASNPAHQNQVQYLSQSGPTDPITVQPLGSNVKVDAPTHLTNTKSLGVFPSSDSSNYATFTRSTPMARAGGSRRRHRRGTNRRLSRGKKRVYEKKSLCGGGVGGIDNR